MTMPLTHIQENLNQAYVHAIVSSAGAKYNPAVGQEYGIDCTIQQLATMPNGKVTNSGYILQCQLKATTNLIEKPTYVAYDLDADSYNKLVAFETKSTILIVFGMPKETLRWIAHSEACLELRHCCYWYFLEGEPIDNSKSKRIKIPRTQVFDVPAVTKLLNRLQAGKGSLK